MIYPCLALNGLLWDHQGSNGVLKRHQIRDTGRNCLRHGHHNRGRFALFFIMLASAFAHTARVTFGIEAGPPASNQGVVPRSYSKVFKYSMTAA
jgi:hypothetical protein